MSTSAGDNADKPSQAEVNSTEKAPRMKETLTEPESEDTTEGTRGELNKVKDPVEETPGGSHPIPENRIIMPGGGRKTSGAVSGDNQNVRDKVYHIYPPGVQAHRHP